MKLAILLLILAVGMIPISSYADSGEIGYKLLPEKILEYTDGTLQVFVEADGIMIPLGIVGLKATSTDSEIIKIIGIEPANEYITNIKIQALKPGEANIALAAPGFLSQEIPIKVYDNNNFPTQIQMKITPNVFPVDGPKYGYIGVELLTTGGLPTKAENDTLIKFSTPNNDIIELEKDQVLIKKGEYFALNEFKVLRSGDPIIFAETEGMKKISTFIEIQEAAEPYKIQVYAFPSSFTSYSGSSGYLIVQLQDDDGVPVIAGKDAHVSITTTNPDAEKNVSDDFVEIMYNENRLTIKEGSYWAYTSFTPRPDLGDFTEDEFQEYTISASAEDFMATSTEITVLHKRVGDDEIGQIKGGILIGEGPGIFHDVPFLTTGKKELIGAVILEAEIDFIDKLSSFTIDADGKLVQDKILEVGILPVITSKNLEMNVGSSNSKTVNFINPIIPEGSNSALVFGNTGTIAPKDCSIEFYLTDNDGVSTIIGDPYGPVEDTLSLNVEPLITKILAGTDFPILGYLMESDSSVDSSGDSDEVSCYEDAIGDEQESGRFGVTQFTEDTILTFSADEYTEIEPISVKQNQAYALMFAKSNKVGTTTFDIRGSNLVSTFTIQSHTTDPTSFDLSYAESVLPDINTLSALQVLDSAGNPVYAKEDIEIILVSSNESVMEVPDTLVITKDNYRTIFEIKTLKEGDAEIAILSEDLPLAKFDLNVKGIQPELKMDISGSGLVGEVMTAKLSVSYPGISLSANELDVEWIVAGAEIMFAQELTNENGQASIELISNTPSTANVKAVVNGIGISNAESVVSYSFAHPEGYVEIVESDKTGLGGIGLDSSDIIYFIIPGAAAGTFLFLKRTNRLEGLGEKFDEIKEHISEIRERD